MVLVVLLEVEELVELVDGEVVVDVAIVEDTMLIVLAELLVLLETEEAERKGRSQLSNKRKIYRSLPVAVLVLDSIALVLVVLLEVEEAVDVKVVVVLLGNALLVDVVRVVLGIVLPTVVEMSRENKNLSYEKFISLGTIFSPVGKD